ncbi:MAG: hypothetical protein OHK93_005744 [Ramalina farinacea]|uniref:FAM50A/XAP5 C-terminal domain-containing protein n=1 Tax=Ramalina farinacea TaxID=258253 RepID=A0AA43TSD2_9LECA|nr:hypothetical protein [Ramalina farinacea]
MESSNPSSADVSRVPTPNRFTSQAATAEDVLKSQTVGLVHLSDFRKRRAEALERKERGLPATHADRFAPASSTSGGATPNDGMSDGVTTPSERSSKKRKKAVAKGKLSFGVEDDGDNTTEAKTTTPDPNALTREGSDSAKPSPSPSRDETPPLDRRRLGPNTSLSVAPKTLTKSALLKEAQAREQLRKEFLVMQEAVKATEVVIPFVFYDGTNVPGGACKVKKGDPIWLILDRSRKLGAELGVGGGGERGSSKREWARVGVDDLMLLRGEVIIPHHYDIYYFLVNKAVGPNGTPVFDFSSTTDTAAAAPASLPAAESETNFDPLSLPGKTTKTKNTGLVTATDDDLEGYDDDPNFTKVVDRRWYEKNKHIFPASMWEEYDPAKDYPAEVRRDALGNSFFFS